MFQFGGIFLRWIRLRSHERRRLEKETLDIPSHRQNRDEAVTKPILSRIRPLMKPLKSPKTRKFASRQTAPKQRFCPPIPQANPTRRLAVEERNLGQTERQPLIHPANPLGRLPAKTLFPQRKSGTAPIGRAKSLRFFGGFCLFPTNFFLNFFLFFCGFLLTASIGEIKNRAISIWESYI